MAVELGSRTDKIEGLIQQDLVGGSHQTFDYVVDVIKTKTGVEEGVIDSSFIDIKIIADRDKVFDLLLLQTGDVRYIYGSILDDKGNALTNNYTWIYSDKQGVDIYGNLRNSMDGHDWEVTPKMFADFLAEALGTLNDYNWKIS